VEILANIQLNKIYITAINKNSLVTIYRLNIYLIRIEQSLLGLFLLSFLSFFSLAVLTVLFLLFFFCHDRYFLVNWQLLF
jgi:hypothetical protein